MASCTSTAAHLDFRTTCSIAASQAVKALTCFNAHAAPCAGSRVPDDEHEQCAAQADIYAALFETPAVTVQRGPDLESSVLLASEAVKQTSFKPQVSVEHVYHRHRYAPVLQSENACVRV